MFSWLEQLRSPGPERSSLSAAQFCTDETPVLPGRSLLQVIEAVKLLGHDPHVVLEGTGLNADAISRAPGRISWRVLCTAFDNLERVGVTMEGFEEVGARIACSPLLLPRTVAAFFPRPDHLLYVFLKWMGPALFPVMTHELSYVARGRLRLEVELPAGFRDGAPFFFITKGVIGALPAVFGHSRAFVRATITPRTGTFDIECAPRPLGLRSVGRRLRALVSARLVVNTLGGLEDELRGGLESGLESQRQFRRIMDALPDGVAIFREHQVLYVNPALGGLLDEKPSALLGRTWAELPLGEEPAVEAAPREVRVGERVIELSSPHPIVYEGRPAQLLAARDVTARRELEHRLALADKVTTLGNLAAGIAHEINNPLTLVLAHLELAARQPAACDTHLDAIREGALRVRDIVKDLRIFFTSEENAPGAVDVADIVRSTLALARGKASGIATIELDAKPAPAVNGDPGRLGQVLLNLILNALEAMPESRPASENRVIVRVRQEGREVLVEVSDNGRGIDPAAEPRVFEPFFSTKQDRVGSGLGLAVAQGIVTGYGGKLSFTTRPGVGTTFRVALVPATPRAEATAAADAVATSARSLRILLVDDEPALVRIVAEALTDRGHDVATAGSGAEAIARIERDPHLDVIVCDLMMPNGSGADVHEHLLQHHPELADRMLFMTGGSFRPEVRSFLARTRNRCLAKPFGLDDLTTAIEQV